MRLGVAVVAIFAAGTVTPSRAADCTTEKPCTLPFVTFARQRVVEEKKMAARMVNAPATEHNLNVADQYDQHLKEGIAAEKEFFSKWCEITIEYRDKLSRNGSKLTSELVYPQTGQPDEEQRLERSGAEGKVWMWHVEGPFSGSVVFSITFSRRAGTEDAWEFAGCSWCVAGGIVMPRGCVELPWKP